VAISKHFTVNQAQTLIEEQSFIFAKNRQFLVGAVTGCPSCAAELITLYLVWY
jgi:hypothetical protein